MSLFFLQQSNVVMVLQEEHVTISSRSTMHLHFGHTNFCFSVSRSTIRMYPVTSVWLKAAPLCLQMLRTQSYVSFLSFQGWFYFFYRSIITDDYFFFAVWTTFSKFTVSVFGLNFWQKFMYFRRKRDNSLLSSSFVFNVNWKYLRFRSLLGKLPMNFSHNH